MKKLLFAIVMSLVMVSCGNNQINGNTTEYTTGQRVDSILSVYGFASTMWLYHIKQIVYKDSTLRYIDVEWKDSLISEKAMGLYEEKNFYEVTNIDTTYTNIVWYDIDENRYFFNNTTREIIMMIQLGIDGINDKTMLSKYYTNVPNTIDECIKQFSN